MEKFILHVVSGRLQHNFCDFSQLPLPRNDHMMTSNPLHGGSLIYIVALRNVLELGHFDNVTLGSYFDMFLNDHLVDITISLSDIKIISSILQWCFLSLMIIACFNYIFLMVPQFAATK